MDGKFHFKSGTGNDPPPVTGQSPTFSFFLLLPLGLGNHLIPVPSPTTLLLYLLLGSLAHEKINVDTQLS